MNSRIDKQRIEELESLDRESEGLERGNGGWRKMDGCISDSCAQARFNDILPPLKLKSCKRKRVEFERVRGRKKNIHPKFMLCD